MTERPDDLLHKWVESPDFEGELVHVERRAASGAIYAETATPITPALSSRLAERGIERLYRHQARAIDQIRSGVHTVMVAGTAAGKTLGYQIPIIESLLRDEPATSLLLYPTKALARDQLRSFAGFNLAEVVAEAYDGDTPSEQRTWIRRKANVVLTNPDMLHVGILPYHAKWAEFFHRLSYVVIDEMHTLRGIFGSHVAQIVRRLRRVCDLYGSAPVFVLGSATIGNPEELARALTGLDVAVIDEDSSPKGEQLIALWNPPVSDHDANRRRSALAESTDLFVDLVRSGMHTIAFTRSRKGTELMFRWAVDRVPDRETIAPYRAGYLPAQRRDIESRLFAGRLSGIITTNALELGIDVGSLDAAVLTTFPGTISSFRQQSGRAGRTRDRSLVALVGGEDALDQYFMAHPHELFSRQPEAAVVNATNPFVSEAHAGCAAYEMPLTLGDREVLGEAVEEAANRLVQSGHLRQRGESLYWAGRRHPAPQVDIRTGGRGSYQIIDEGEGSIGTLDASRVYRDGHPGAVYLHQGDSYVVEELDESGHEVRVSSRPIDYYTQPKEEKILEVTGLSDRTGNGVVEHFLGWVRVESQVVGFQRRRLGSRDLIDTVPLDLPVTAFETQSIWWAIPPSVTAVIDPRDLPGALHAAEHAAIGMLPLLAVCDRWDIGGLSTPWHSATGEATIFIYEAYPGGAGISPVAFEREAEHLSATLAAIRACPCTGGCPSCIQSPKCGNFNEPLSKAGAITLLEHML